MLDTVTLHVVNELGGLIGVPLGELVRGTHAPAINASATTHSTVIRRNISATP
jgi:hypothetical protein